MAYGIDLDEWVRKAAEYVADSSKARSRWIFRCVEGPNKYALAFNRKTAKALGLTIPQAPLATADAVIE